MIIIPSNVSAAVGVAQLTGVTYSQSSVENGSNTGVPGVVAATYAGMNNNSASETTQTLTSWGVSGWIKADCGATKNIDHIVLGYDVAGNLGAGPLYSAGMDVQGSNDNSSWTSIFTTKPGVEANLASGLATIDIKGSWRYIRLYSSTQHVQATEFQIWGT